MTDCEPGNSGHRPLVVMLFSVPLLAEAVRAALEPIADVQSFPTRAGDTVGLLRSLRPDAVVVDSETEAAQAAAVAAGADVPVFHIDLRAAAVRAYEEGRWVTVSDGEDPTPEGIRNAVVAGLYAREPIR
jgi:hypothetical protein